jgi:hydroxymethylpyrimidine pyrophosphatase-like HAD family hydrolase
MPSSEPTIERPIGSATAAAVQYARELDELPRTYATARAADPDQLRSALSQLAAGTARYIGTGGTTPVARLAAQLHEFVSGQPARAMTPLEFLDAPRLRRAGAVLFSSRAKHADAKIVLDRLSGDAYAPSVLVTHREPAELDLAENGPIRVVTIAAPRIREGFLATNSVLAMSTALVAAALGDEALPAALPAECEPLGTAASGEDRLLVLYPPMLAPVAADIETRCAELGLVAVQTSDLRNFAHGRHTGLARTSDRHRVLVLSDRTSRRLADAIHAPLASHGVRIARWHADEEWPAATLQLLAASMHLTGQLADAARIDPARPSVPEFGRRLYHLPLRRLLAQRPLTPVQAKAAALGAGQLATGEVMDHYATAYRSWVDQLSATAYGSLVLDYDGTVCTTEGRVALPTDDIRDVLLRVMKAGLVLGFASGRGKSLHNDLRAWVPEHQWGRVHLGMYNGAVLQTLADQVPDTSSPSALMADVSDRLASADLGRLLKTVPRSDQVTVTPIDTAFFHAGRLAELVGEILRRPPLLDVKIVSSAHSVDIVAGDTSKVRVLRAVAEQSTGEVLAIGDQGDIAGNDFELLGATSYSVSVDRVSADPTRCWNLDFSGARGPDALVRLLAGSEFRDGLMVLKVPRKARSRA